MLTICEWLFIYLLTDRLYIFQESDSSNNGEMMVCAANDWACHTISRLLQLQQKVFDLEKDALKAEIGKVNATATNLKERAKAAEEIVEEKDDEIDRMKRGLSSTFLFCSYTCFTHVQFLIK